MVFLLGSKQAWCKSLFVSSQETDLCKYNHSTCTSLFALCHVATSYWTVKKINSFSLITSCQLRWYQTYKWLDSCKHKGFISLFFFSKINWQIIKLSWEKIIPKLYDRPTYRHSRDRPRYRLVQGFSPINPNNKLFTKYRFNPLYISKLNLNVIRIR